MINTNENCYRRRTRGFTLIELLLYVSIVSTVLGAITLFLSLSLSSGVKNQSISEVNQQGIAIIERVTTTARNADSVTSPAVGASGSTLALAMPAAAISPTIFDASISTPSAFQVKEGGGNTIPLTNNKVTVSGLAFKNLSKANTPGTIQISFTLSRVNTSGRNEYDYQKQFITTVTLR